MTNIGYCDYYFADSLIDSKCHFTTVESSSCGKYCLVIMFCLGPEVVVISDTVIDSRCHMRKNLLNMKKRPQKFWANEMPTSISDFIWAERKVCGFCEGGFGIGIADAGDSFTIGPPSLPLLPSACSACSAIARENGARFYVVATRRPNGADS